MQKTAAAVEGMLSRKESSGSRDVRREIELRVLCLEGVAGFAEGLPYEHAQQQRQLGDQRDDEEGQEGPAVHAEGLPDQLPQVPLRYVGGGPWLTLGGRLVAIRLPAVLEGSVGRRFAHLLSLLRRAALPTEPGVVRVPVTAPRAGHGTS